jgi:hypothetical protein
VTSDKIIVVHLLKVANPPSIVFLVVIDNGGELFIFFLQFELYPAQENKTDYFWT